MLSHSIMNSGTQSAIQRRWKSLVKEICAADIICNLDSSALTTIVQGDYFLQPIEFIKNRDYCFLITEYPNGPRLSDILTSRKENGNFIDAQILPEFKSEDSFQLDGYISDQEAMLVIQQVVEICTDLYMNKLCLYDLNPDNFLTHFEQNSVFMSP